MTDLLTALQSAERGSRELDEAIAVHFKLGEVGWRQANYTMENHPYLQTPSANHVGGFAREPLPFWTTSIDAALALVERVLPGWKWSLTTLTTSIGGFSQPEAFVCPPDLPGGAEITAVASAPTPPLALVIALVRAKEASDA